MVSCSLEAIIQFQFVPGGFSDFSVLYRFSLFNSMNLGDGLECFFLCVCYMWVFLPVFDCVFSAALEMIVGFLWCWPSYFVA